MSEDAGAPPPDPGVVLARRLLVAAAMCVVLAAVTYVLMVRTQLGQRFDNIVVLGGQRQSLKTRLSDAFFLERIRVGTFIVVLIVIAGIGLVRRRPRAGFTMALAALLAVAGTDLAKDDILTRPPLSSTDAVLRSNTFPSGHTAIAIGCALALVILSPPAWRGLVAVLAGSYSFLVAADVQTAGWHRPSDAIGASLLAFATTAAAAAVLARRRPVGAGRRTSHRVAYPLLGLVGIAAGFISALNATRFFRPLARTPDSTLPPGDVLDQAYQFSVYLTVFVVVCLLITLLLLLGAHDLDQPEPA